LTGWYSETILRFRINFFSFSDFFVLKTHTSLRKEKCETKMNTVGSLNCDAEHVCYQLHVKAQRKGSWSAWIRGSEDIPSGIFQQDCAVQKKHGLGALPWFTVWFGSMWFLCGALTWTQPTQNTGWYTDYPWQGNSGLSYKQRHVNLNIFWHIKTSFFLMQASQELT